MCSNVPYFIRITQEFKLMCWRIAVSGKHQIAQGNVYKRRQQLMQKYKRCRFVVIVLLIKLQTAMRTYFKASKATNECVVLYIKRWRGGLSKTRLV